MESESWQSPKSLKRLTVELMVKMFITSRDRSLSQLGLTTMETIFLLQDVIFPAIEKFKNLIATSDRLKKLFQRAVMESMESVILDATVGYSHHLFYFFIQFLTLDEVFIGNIFSRTPFDGRVLAGPPGKFPSNPEMVLIPLINKCAYFQTIKLTLIAPLPHYIIRAILKKSPNLKELKVSSVNITDDAITSMAEFCPELKVLKLVSVCGVKLSVGGITRGFFPNLELEDLINLFEDKKVVEVSFPDLQEFVWNVRVKIYGPVLDKMFYHYYASCNSLAKFRSLTGPNRSILPSEPILSLIRVTDKVILKLKEISFSEGFLRDLTASDLLSLVTSLPDIESVYVYVEYSPNLITSTAIGRLKYLLQEFSNLHSFSFHFRFLSLNDPVVNFLSSTIASIGSKLVNITLTLDGTEGTSVMHFLKDVFNNCPSLSTLTVGVTDKLTIDYRPIINGTFTIPTNCLKDFRIREFNPNSANVNASMLGTSYWIKMLRTIQSSSPQLLVLGTTFYTFGRLLLSKLSTTASTFYLYNNHTFTNRFNGKYDKFDSSYVIQMVMRIPNLKFLYLQNLGHSDFKAIHDHFVHTDLQVINFTDETLQG